MCLVVASLGPKAIYHLETCSNFKSWEFCMILPIGLVDEEVNHYISVLNKGNPCSESI